MQKKKIFISDNSPSAYPWPRDPEFILPHKSGAGDCALSESAPRAGELRTLLENCLDIIIGTVNATAGVVRLLSPDGQTMQIISSAGLSAELQQEAEHFVELDCAVRDSATLGHVVHATDISACDARQTCPHATCRFQSLVAAPLEASAASGWPLGILTIFFDVPRESSSHGMNIIAAFAEMMGATIEHTRINRETKRIERMKARQAMANDIHDTLAQTLIYARMRVSVLQEALRSANPELAAQCADDLDEAMEIGQKSARELITDFRGEIDSGGLLTALHDLTRQFRGRNAIALDYHNRLVDLELPLEYEIEVFHIVREALTNVARHSGATHARLFVEACGGYYVFTIEDNGCGSLTFTPVEGHYGVMIMRERAQRIGGEITVDSKIGAGTQVQLSFPAPTLDWRAVND
jgi:two-component system nitrate/nitrite sensor histidine kinase NarX